MSKNSVVTYQDEENQLEGFLAYKLEEKKPLVILCHAWKGRDDFICEKAKQIAELGYVGFALDIYGKGILGKNKEECIALKKPFIENRYLLQKRLLKGYHKACSLPYVDPTRIVVLGFGFGGLCALDLARSGVDIKGAITIYGHFDSPKNCPQQSIKAKICVLHGYNDPISSMSDLILFQQELNNAGIEWQSHIYGNTFHAFATPSANDLINGIVYNPLAAKQAWDEVERFLAEVLS
jgi:dienelactone hydrolase